MDSLLREDMELGGDTDNYGVEICEEDGVCSPASHVDVGEEEVTITEFPTLSKMQENSMPLGSYTEKFQSGLPRWPPSVTLDLKELSSLITCGICKGFFFNATTITECLHTFCRSCISKHAERSLICPSCGILIHPTDPTVNMRTDSTLQDIVYNLLPMVRKEHEESQKKFYTSKGLQWPPVKQYNSSQSNLSKRYINKLRKQLERPMFVSLHHAGTTPEIGRYKSLDRRYLKIPARTTIYHVKLFLRIKLKLPDHIDAVIFAGDKAIKDSVNIDTLSSSFNWGEKEDHTIKLQYGIVPKEAFNALLDGTLPTNSDSESDEYDDYSSQEEVSVI